VIGKGNKERLVSLPPDLGRELRRFLRRRPGSGRIFLSRVRARGDYQPLDKNALTQMLERLGKTAEIAKPVHPHVLRHTFATRAAAQGVVPIMLADQLGHTTLTMVRRHIQASGPQKADRWDRIWKEWEPPSEPLRDLDVRLLNQRVWGANAVPWRPLRSLWLSRLSSFYLRLGFPASCNCKMKRGMSI
jgi:integrase